MADTAPSERGSPANRGAKGSGVLTRPMGPLPTWGWLAVAAAGLLLYRFMAGRSQAASQAAQQGQQTSSLPYVPGGGVGGVFLLPGGGGAAAPAAPAAPGLPDNLKAMLDALNQNQFTEIQNQAALSTNEVDILNKLGGLAPGNAFYATSQQYQSFNPSVPSRPGGATTGAPSTPGGPTKYPGAPGGIGEVPAGAK